MSEAKKQNYLLLSRTDAWYEKLSHEELQELIAANKAWVGKLFSEGKARPGFALAREGATVFAQGKRVVLDGPYPESKEAICGTLILAVESFDEAIAIAQACPSLRFNAALEIRPISDACPLETCARQKQQGLAAVAA